MSAALLDAHDIRKRYGALEVLRGVGLSVRAGEAFAIIGPNGAGKTTLFKVLTGETLDYTGEVRFDGADVSRVPAFRRVRAGFGRTFQVARVFGGMSALRNVVVAVEAREAGRGRRPGRWWDPRPDPAIAEEARTVLDSVGLLKGCDVTAGLLSHGDKKRLEFALALAARPRILMLDEPTAGMSAEDRRATARLLAELKRNGTTLVLTEHDMTVVFDLADRVLVLNQGEEVCLGPPEQVRADERVRRVYLGQGSDA